MTGRSHPGGPVLREPRADLRGVTPGHEPVGHLLRHQPGRARPVAGQRELAHSAQVRTPVQLPEQPRHGGVQHVARDHRARRRRGCGRVVGQAAVHHAGDLDRLRIPPGRPRGVADEAGRLARLGRR
ncbi:MAG TPA: hypothetical protein VFX25_02295, partial [Streptosporangiaceae bacterium]|nr:hypothetical protein [Streptosporangiaceae bacterium]